MLTSALNFSSPQPQLRTAVLWRELNARAHEDARELASNVKYYLLRMEDLIDAVGGGKVKIENFDCAVFDGNYITGDIDEAYLQKIEQARNDLSKAKTNAVSAIIDLYNN